MSNLTLDHPTADHPTTARQGLPEAVAPDVRTPAAPSAGSYVDTDGRRRPVRLVGEYVSRRSTGARATGSYTDVDAGRSTAGLGSYVRAER